MGKFVWNLHHILSIGAMLSSKVHGKSWTFMHKFLQMLPSIDTLLWKCIFGVPICFGMPKKLSSSCLLDSSVSQHVTEIEGSKYTQSQKKHNFSSTHTLEEFKLVKISSNVPLETRFTNKSKWCITPDGLVYTLLQKKGNFQKVAFLLRKSVDYNWFEKVSSGIILLWLYSRLANLKKEVY